MTQLDVSGPSVNGMGDSASDSSRKEIRVGAVVAGVFFFGLLGWAALTPLDAGATAQGVVAVSGNRQAVQHRDGGIGGSGRRSRGASFSHIDLRAGS